MMVVFDLDGTLALNEHRQHYVERPVGEKDWRSFFAACDRDIPNLPIIRVLTALWMAGERVEIWSGRSAEVSEQTDEWLRKNGIGHIARRMRPEGDHTPDHELKKQWLEEARQEGNGPVLVFDDRASVVAMWRENGVTCAQVAEGNF